MNRPKKKPKEKLHSNKIKLILQEIGMTQAELADMALEGNYSHLSLIINGKRRCISLPIAIRIAKALKRPIEDIFIYNKEIDAE